MSSHQKAERCEIPGRTRTAGGALVGGYAGGRSNELFDQQPENGQRFDFLGEEDDLNGKLFRPRVKRVISVPHEPACRKTHTAAMSS